MPCSLSSAGVCLNTSTFLWSSQIFKGHVYRRMSGFLPAGLQNAIISLYVLFPLLLRNIYICIYQLLGRLLCSNIDSVLNFKYSKERGRSSCLFLPASGQKALQETACSFLRSLAYIYYLWAAFFYSNTSTQIWHFQIFKNSDSSYDVRLRKATGKTCMFSFSAPRHM
jgi:hypothetical protein